MKALGLTMLRTTEPGPLYLELGGRPHFLRVGQGTPFFVVWVVASFVTKPMFHAGVWEEVGEIAIACVIPELCLVYFRGWLQLTMQVTSLRSDGEPTVAFRIIGGF